MTVMTAADEEAKTIESAIDAAMGGHGEAFLDYACDHVNDGPRLVLMLAEIVGILGDLRADNAALAERVAQLEQDAAADDMAAALARVTT